MEIFETNFSAALTAWKGGIYSIFDTASLTDASDVNLTELQKTLDAQGIELVDNQKESVIGRKALAEKTKGLRPTLTSLFHSTQYFPVLEFKKIAEEEKLNAFKGLLKGMRQVHDFYMIHIHTLVLSLPDGD
jgi:homeobox protein cut-like